MEQTAALAREFERESARINQLIWDAMAFRAGETALFCGVANNLDWIKRAVEIGVEVSVAAGDAPGSDELRRLGVNVLRGSTSMLPAHDASFDVGVAFHYLHEIDPFFHAAVVSELGRVSRRCAIVEPAPPSDPLGLRIATLYSRAKRELGQFENYHHLEYWRKLLAIVKPEVRCETFTFMRTPPRTAIRETVALIIDMMAAEDIPKPYLAELRALAQRPDAQLLPQARYVIVGAPAGDRIGAGAGTPFRKRPATDDVPKPLESPFTAATIAAAVTPPPLPRVYSHPTTEAELPPIQAPEAVPTPAAGLSRVARNAFGLAPEEPSPRRAEPVPAVAEDFGLPTDAHDAAAEYGWEWEPPPNA